MANDHARIGLLAGTHDRVAQLHDEIIVDRIALFGTIQPDDRNRAVEFVCDEVRGHDQLPLQRG